MAAEQYNAAYAAGYQAGTAGGAYDPYNAGVSGDASAYMAGFNVGADAAKGGAGTGAARGGVTSVSTNGYAGAYNAGSVVVDGLPPVPANAVVHTTGCATAGCVSAGCATGGVATMALVGAGNGEYITETTYRYVGQGQGNLTVVTPRTFLWGRILGLVAVVGLVGAGIAMYKPAKEEPVQQLNLGVGDEMAVCTYWGDPHLKTFDGARPSFYGNGEYYVVKSAEVSIQGRYMGTKYTEGLAATNKIAVGGAFMDGHILTIGSLEDGPIRIDGVPVLTAFPSRRQIENVGEVTYTSEGDLVDQATAQWEKKVVKLEVPGKVTLEVFRWSNYIDLRIQMPENQEVDGGCGNNNGDAFDDTTEAIFNRIGARVPEGELLFHQRTAEELSDVEEKLLTMCEPETLGTAQKECATDLSNWEASPATTTTKSCMLDICYGSNEHTLRMAKGLGLVPKDSAAMNTQ